MSIQSKATIFLTHVVSHDFANGWEDLNPSIQVCEAKATAQRRVASESDGGQKHKVVVGIGSGELAKARLAYRKARPGISFRRFLEAAAGAHFSGGCRCEHDCCGHRQHHGIARMVSPRELVVTISSYLNV